MTMCFVYDLRKYFASGAIDIDVPPYWPDDTAATIYVEIVHAT